MTEYACEDFIKIVQVPSRILFLQVGAVGDLTAAGYIISKHGLVSLTRGLCYKLFISVILECLKKVRAFVPGRTFQV